MTQEGRGEEMQGSGQETERRQGLRKKTEVGHEGGYKKSHDVGRWVQSGGKERERCPSRGEKDRGERPRRVLWRQSAKGRALYLEGT